MRLSWVTGCAATFLFAGGAFAQPSYLTPLLNDIERTPTESFHTVTFRLYERIGANVYSRDDLLYLSRSLLRRAESARELLPVVLPLLGQMGLPETVAPIMAHGRSNDEWVRTAAYQALGWIGDPKALPMLTERQGRAGSAEERFMLDYAIKAIQTKARLKAMTPTEQFVAVRNVVLTEPNWLARADIARMLSRSPNPEVWNVLFTSYERWTDTPQFVQMIGETIGARYRFDPSGYFAAVRNRPPETRLYALARISDFPHISDMGAIMDLSETDPDVAVRERSMVLLGKLLNR